MDTSELTLRDKVAIVDLTARIALSLLLVIVAFSELVVAMAG
jgi:hypothetical protein